MGDAGSIKVLFSGAPKGNVQALMKKVEAANKKVGAEALFCVGQFFGACCVPRRPQACCQ